LYYIAAKPLQKGYSFFKMLHSGDDLLTMMQKKKIKNEVNPIIPDSKNCLLA